MYLTGTMQFNEAGHLEIGGIDVVDLARDYGTPLWVIDELGFRQNCRAFRDAFARQGNSLVLYASKALTSLAIIRMVNEEGLGLDVVSGGELYTALEAGFPPQLIYFHGNNKSIDEITLAIDNSVGRIVVDNFYELSLLSDLCRAKNYTQDILLRITPGVEAHTHEFIQTGQIDSKFGFTLPDGQAMEGIKMALNSPNINLVGLHCHIGSQVFEMDSFRQATALMMDFVVEIHNKLGYQLDEIDMGGGFGIYYSAGDDPTYADDWADAVMSTVAEKARQANINIPRVIVEPGRAIVGPAGVTIYSIGSWKEVTNVRKYLAVDGGMADNIRTALYDAKYSAILGNKANLSPQEVVSIAGKCCESGDMLIWDIELPAAEAGDLLVVFATGAYNYSMSSNYNRLPRPAMVLVNDGRSDVIIKRETYADLISNDIIPQRLKAPR
ncbi:MAG: diaminopimelate decarboxylase [Syntrophomonadaceae bacterium]|nr:diaminopimelate decarboxylase [Syntrophomonadaceae bacterium]